jgi:hypothetical protein
MIHFSRIAVFTWALFAHFSLSAQYNIPQNAVWAMGQKCGVNFNTNPPTALATNIVSGECSAAVSDGEGALLFYTDGTKVWDASGTVMPNGASLNGIPDHTLSTTQGALIVPDPANSKKYYLLSLGISLYVNRIDMDLNNGNGDVDLSFSLKGVKIADSMGEKMIAIRGCSNNVWVLTKRNWENKFYAYNISEAGFNTVPVVSMAGHFQPHTYFQGEMKVSPDRKKIVTVSTNPGQGGMELYDFDFVSGMVYNPVIVDNTTSYGAAFSPDGKKLYTINQPQNKVMQYNLNAPQIALSRTPVGNCFGSTDLKLAIDGKIYFLSLFDGLSTIGFSRLGRINNPDALGLGCLAQDSVTALTFQNSDTTGLFVGLPNEVVIAKSNTGDPLENRVMLDTTFCAGSIFPGMTLNTIPGFIQYLWDDNSNGLSRHITQSGTYWVSYKTLCGTRTDTFKVSAAVIPELVLQYNSPVLSATSSYSTYQWYKDGQLLSGQTGPTLTVTDIGWYSLKAGDGSGCSDSAAYHVTSVTDIGSPDPAGRNIRIYPNPAKDVLYVDAPVPVTLQLTDARGRIMMQSKERKLQVASLASGMYFLYIRDAKTGKLIRAEKITR